MNKAELGALVAENFGYSNKKDGIPVVEYVFEQIEQAILNGDKVSISGFGSFELVETKARTGRNINTGEEIQIPAKNKPKFKAAKALKEKMNE